MISLLLFISSLLGICAAIGCWSANFEWIAPSPIYLGVCPLAIKIDKLSSFFLILLFTISLAVSLFSPGYLTSLKEQINRKFYWVVLLLFIFSMGATIVASNALTFLLFWEIMSLSSGGLVAIDSGSKKNQKAAMIYFGSTRIATAFLAGGFLWCYSIFGSWSFTDWHIGSPQSLGASVLILLGFAIKAGLWPFHIWLPYAYPAAPAPVSALMSGVMSKIAMYGIIRIFIYQDHWSPFIAISLIVLGAVSSVWGILFALVQHDLKRLLSYSSVENTGLISLALGLFLYGKSFGLDKVADISLVAALFHCWNHGLFKSLLFFGSGAIDSVTHTRELNQLGGLAQKMPWTMMCFLIGSLAISALPPFNGFVSKWLIYQGLFQVAINSKNVVHIGVALALICTLAIVGGLAIGCFTKAVGICFLGKARSGVANSAHECTKSMVGTQVVLAGACLLVGLGSSQCSNLLATLVPGNNVLVNNIPGLAMGFIGALLIILSVLVYIMVLGNKQRVKKYGTWDCGYGKLTAHMQATADSFAQPIASLLSPVLQYSMHAEISGQDRRHFPEHIKAEADIKSLLESKIYGPLVGSVKWLSGHVSKLQAGSIHLYLLYLLLTVISLVLIGVVE